MHWIDKPRIGQRIVPRTDLFSSPWQCSIAGPSYEHLIAVEGRIRETIGWNKNAKGVQRAFRKFNAYATLFNKKFRERQRLYAQIPLQNVPRT